MTDAAASHTSSQSGAEGFRSLVESGTAHFMGAAGAGMRALAEAVARSGGRVSACDVRPGGADGALERVGVRISEGHDPAHVKGCAVLVVSSAVPDHHPEIERARALGVPIYKRARALGEWVNEGLVVGVAGTHGKTTTTAMVAAILSEAGLEPTAFVGGRVADWESHLLPGRDDLFVVEADEYDRSFHHLRPTVTIVTNVEADHLDVYGDRAGVEEAFRAYLRGVTSGGTVIACADDPGASALLTGVGGRGRSYGFAPGSQLWGEHLELRGRETTFRVVEEGRRLGRLRLALPGKHNALNALGAAAVARALDVDWAPIASALRGFRGVDRRFQHLGGAGGIEIVDDYAHHPTEVAAAIQAARSRYPESRLVVVFQPHLYTRTRDFAAEFAHALAGADVVWITEIYPAREAPIPGVDAALVARHLEETRGGTGTGRKGPDVRLHAELDGLADELKSRLRSGDVCLTLGAGSIERVGPELAAALAGRKGERGDV